MKEGHKNLKKFKIDHLLTIEPITDHQAETHVKWKKENKNLVLSGCAGTGKTFNAFYLALEDVLDAKTPWETIHIIRSVVPSREMGFLPGTIDEKFDPYTAPYKKICAELFGVPQAYERLIDQGVLDFHSTSFIRGTTFEDSIIIVDEMQNMNGRELNTIITRLGDNTKIIFAGDYYQSDFANEKEKKDILDFLTILDNMKSFSHIEFTWKDIVRSDLVRDYILTKEMLKKDEKDFSISW